MEIRELVTLEEFAQIAPLCRAVWGDDDEPENKDLLMAMVHEGALCMGCWDSDRLVGYLFGFPTSDPTVQHSHRLAIDPSHRRSGLGAQMKLAQRDWCLARGITTIRWTYDPARLVNARLNIVRLGARGVRYLPNYYGEMGGINAGAPSDRMLASWPLTAERPAAEADGDVLVELPPDFAEMLGDAPADALAWRERHRRELAPLLDDGWAIVNVERLADLDRWAYRVRAGAATD